MLDIKYIRENLEKVKKALEKKHTTFDLEGLLKLDDSRRDLQKRVEMLRAERRAYLEESCRKIRSDFDSQFEVDLHIVDEIPRTPGGKHLYTISDVLKPL